ncbi:abortive infection protein [Brevibacterium sediminis]|uniref:Abortive infection protein n=1 Tax=Brevibacterium sediminis TaxID=1857024 RepID=A0ABQ1LSB5_9MICO|nr:CPBP family intramembrane glutamic endopeptidase [Brevibacterium sediminis]GGC28955.1 abortive infection protein [Brevibacterium sediminis]
MNTQTHSHNGFAEATGPTEPSPQPTIQPHRPGTTDSMPGSAASAMDGSHTPAEDVDAKGRPLAVVPARVPWLEIGIFTVTAFGLAWLACLPLWFSEEGIGDPVLLLACGSAMMFTPLIASIIASIIQRRRARARGEVLASAPRYFGYWPLRSFGRVIGMTIAAFFGIMVLVVLGYLVSAAFGWLALDLDGLSGFKAQLETIPGTDSLPTAAAIAIYLLLMFVSSVANVGVTIGEEFGWRGWLLTSLRPLGTWPALLIIGVVWGLWHSPLILLGYNFGRPDLTGVGFMVGGCIVVGILFGWLRLRTGSVWPAVFAHAALNGCGAMLLGLFVDAGASTPDPALVAFLGVAGWIVSAVVIAVLVVTGQFRKQPELGIKAKAGPES